MDAGKTFAEGPDGGWVQYQKITSTQSQLSQPEDPLAGGGLALSSWFLWFPWCL